MTPTTIPVRLMLDRWQSAIEPYAIRIDSASGHQVEWLSRDGSIEIAFAGGVSPFEGGGSFSAAAPEIPVFSGAVRLGLEKDRQFPYEATIRSPKGAIARLNGVVLIAPDVKSVAIAVEISQDGAGNLVVTPDPVTANRPSDERIEWHCAIGRFEVNFDKGNGTPFEESIFAAEKDGKRRSARWRTGDLGRASFKYSVRVWVPGEPRKDLDPGVVVDDNGGDDGLL